MCYSKGNNKKKIGMAMEIVLPTTACLLMLTCIYLATICKSRGTPRDK